MEKIHDNTVYWCDNCNSPILKNGDCPLCGHQVKNAFLGKGEIRPIFDYEKRWCKELLISEGYDPGIYLPEGLCFYYNGSVVADGLKIFRVTYDENSLKWKIIPNNKFKKNPIKLLGSELKTVIEANITYLEQAEYESLQFIEKVYSEYEDHPFAVSLSGGKDSVVTLNLVRQIIPTFDSIWMNTTIDYPETEIFIKKLAQEWDLTLFELKPEKDFFTLCDELGPPSKFMRWCCKTMKFAPFNQFIDKQYDKNVLTASGVRKNESSSRGQYDLIQVNNTIPKQILFFPILEWNSLQVWLYIFWKKIPINEVYLKGYSRIGCWLCPEKSLREFKKMETTHPKLSNKLHSYLINYSKKNNITDIENWIKQEKWRYRVSRYEKERIYKQNTCSIKPQYIYNINNIDKKDEIIQFLKIFGPINKKNKFITIQNHNLDLAIINNNIRVKYYSDQKQIRNQFEKQLEKAMNCINCGACIGNCPLNAISMVNGKIGVSDLCTHCLKCIHPKGLRKGCISLNYRTKQIVIN
ncbi:MAG: phosphoadenosine phosphosulfate reductase family protein [Candidatus Bathyarchaeota archaeon]|nr:phosphoadenosine phosphosulfate reductase family protein [Candidatus Bathyarchaeota archaeon]